MSKKNVLDYIRNGSGDTLDNRVVAARRDRIVTGCAIGVLLFFLGLIVFYGLFAPHW